MEVTRTPALALRLLGAFEATVCGQPLRRLRSRKGQWLLAALALRRGAAVQRRWLAGMLWPDSDEAQALASLRQTLSDLRSALGPEAWRLRADGQQSLALVTEGASVDALDMADGVGDGSLAGLTSAVALYRGPLLPGCDEEFLAQERVAYEQLWLQAVERLAALHHERGDHRAAADLLRRGASADPYRESLHRALMRSLAAAGDYAAAIHVFRQLRARLLDELRSEPSAATAAEFEAVRAAARSSSLPAPRPPDPARCRLAAGLPAYHTPFVGREADVALICERLARHRLVTLLGPGGIGKTRLAAEAAPVLARPEDDALLVDLAVVTDEALLTPAIAEAFGLTGAASGGDLGALCAGVGERRCILILDNCEHLVDGCAAVVAALLARCPGIRLLATSRTRLRVPGEQTVRVGPLGLPAQGDRASDLATLAQSPAVRLFVDRAQAASGFRLTASNVDQVVAICRRLEGMPLALELAAARLSAMSIDDLAARLDDLVSVLDRGPRTVAPRQQTLRALIGWSIRLLPPAQQRFFGRLCVFMGGWTLEAAAHVCAGDGQSAVDVQDTLADLVDHSLVQFDHEDTGGRYRMLEPVRQYAGELCRASGEYELAAGLHLEWCVCHAERAARRSSPRLAFLHALEVELDNVRAALDFGASAASHRELRARLAAHVWRFWLVRGRLAEGRHYLDPIVEEGRGRLPSGLRCSLLRGAAALAWGQGDLDRSEALLQEAVQLAGESGDTAQQAACLQSLANVAYSRGRLEDARRLWERALADHRACGDTLGVMGTLNNLANLAHSAGDGVGAEARYREVLETAQRLGDRLAVAASLTGLGNVAKERGDHADALSRYHEAAGIAREAGDREMLAGLLCNLSSLACATGDVADAQRLLCEALEHSRDLGDRRGIAQALDVAAWLALLRGHTRRASQFLRASDGILAALGAARTAIDEAEAARIRLEIGARLGAAANYETVYADALLADADAVREALAALGAPPESPSDRPE